MRYKSYGTPRVLLTVFALAVALAGMGLSGRFAWAQGGETLAYGSNIVGNTTAEIPYAIYAINMNQGDTISLLVAGLTPDMLPSVSMVGPSQNPLAVSEADPFSPAGSHRTRIDYRADQTGGYTIIVTNLNGSPGQFLLMLDGQPASASTSLTLDTPAIATIDSSSALAVYNFQLSTGGNLLTLSTQTPGFSFLARVYDGLGRLVAGLAGTDLRGVALDIGPGVGQYVVEVSALTSGSQGSVRIDLVAGSGGQTGAVLPGGDVIVATATPSVCQVIGANRVNIRSGPSTAYPAIGSLFPGSSLNVVGSNNGLTWFVVDYNGQQGWVSSSVTELGGPCGILPIVPEPPLPPTATPQPTQFPTATPTYTAPSVSFTSTVAEGVTYPPGTCFTFYWNVTNVQAIYFDGQGVTGQGQQQVCPAASRSYVLHIQYPNGTVQDLSIPVLIGP